MTEALRQAARAVLDRWDSPQWEWVKHGPTADLIADLRAALAQPVQQPGAEPIGWQYRWTNPGDNPDPYPDDLEWKPAVPFNPHMQTIEQRLAELRGFTFDGKPCYEVRAIYAALEPLRADAARYRWMAQDGERIGERIRAMLETWDGCDGKAGFDLAIDAAMRDAP